MHVLRQQFPEARFVFLQRDGADSVLSMNRHPMFRLGAIRAVANAVAHPSGSRLAELAADGSQVGRTEDFAGLIAPPSDTERLMAYPLPLKVFGVSWSINTYLAAMEIRKLPSDRWMTMRYEQLLSDPRAELSRLADFIGAPADQRWLARAEEFADPGRTGGALAHLDPGALAELREACAPGAQAFDLIKSEHAQ
jgi:hypothetical protein